VRLSELLARLPGASVHGDAGVTVTGITHDSRRVQPGWIFAACPGARHHGLEFLPQAVARGAAAVLSDRTADGAPDVVWITSSDPRGHMALAAWALAGDPQERLLLAAVTGTNGKSTTIDLLRAILEAHGFPTAMIGTLGYFLPGETAAAERTTPEATDLAPLLARHAAGGGRAVVMEASSHALMLKRLQGLRFQIGVWTNLTRDHLDFHGDMESYFAAKSLLFSRHLAADGRRVLPLDEPWGARLLGEPQPGDVSWGLHAGRVHTAAARSDLSGSRIELDLDGTVLAVRLRLVGEHNLRNAVAAAAAAHAAGVSAEVIRRGLEAARPLPGRLERVAERLPFPVFVDYAHTPEGLRSVLSSLRALGEHRLIVVFGAGGDRDRGKRGPMGEAVGKLADVAIVTSDNPRSEDPAAIAEAVVAGVRAAGAEPELELDRRQAIARALHLADARSVVVVAGKGHEDVQQIGAQRIPFLDRSVVLELADEVSG